MLALLLLLPRFVQFYFSSFSKVPLILTNLLPLQHKTIQHKTIQHTHHTYTIGVSILSHRSGVVGFPEFSERRQVRPESIHDLVTENSCRSWNDTLQRHIIWRVECKPAINTLFNF